MTDLALAWNADLFAADLLLADGALLGDDGLRSAVLISLFSDARAPAGAELPEQGGDPRGWWGDDFAADQFSGPAKEIGSTLWLLHRAKVTHAVLEQARQAAEASLRWLLLDGVASKLAVEVEAQGELRQRLAIGVVIDRPNGPARQRYDFTWDASTRELRVLN